MANRKVIVERRKHARFQVQDGAFAVVSAFSWPHSTKKVGQIINISMGGLSFSYIAMEKLSNEPVELGIFLAHNSFYLRKIPFQKIWDVEMEKVPFSSITMRQRGIQFAGLTDDQISQLKYFIRNHKRDQAAASPPRSPKTLCFV